MELDITFCLFFRMSPPSMEINVLELKGENCVKYWEVMFFIKLSAQPRLGLRWQMVAS